MHTPSALLFMLAAGAPLAVSVHAAPLDALLSAERKVKQGSGEIEAAYDVANEAVDILRIRARDADFSETTVGDYHGVHLRGGVAATPDLWLDSGVWQRRIDLRGDRANITSWHLAGQYKLMDELGYRPRLAARLGIWSNAASRLGETGRTRFLGATLDSMNMAEPRDRQMQLDLIGTWKPRETLRLSAFAGLGASSVRTGAISGTTTQGGCSYNLAFGPTEVVGTLAQPCGGSTVVHRFSVPNSVYGVNVYEEAQYNASFLHGGLGWQWASGRWRMRGGYQYQTLKRKNVDAIIRQRGGSPSTSNHVLIGEVSYELTQVLSVFARGQYMTNQFTGEIPFAYNTFTARRFHKRYGIVSAGLSLSF
jgi:hypothetical protein